MLLRYPGCAAATQGRPVRYSTIGVIIKETSGGLIKTITLSETLAPGQIEY